MFISEMREGCSRAVSKAAKVGRDIFDFVIHLN